MVGSPEEAGEGRGTTAGDTAAGAKAGAAKEGAARGSSASARWQQAGGVVAAVSQAARLRSELEAAKEGHKAEAAAVFLRLDEDGSGALEWREVYVALEELGIDPNCPEVLMAVEDFDQDGNGSLDQTEFESFVAAVRAEES